MIFNLNLLTVFSLIVKTWAYLEEHSTDILAVIQERHKKIFFLVFIAIVIISI